MFSIISIMIMKLNDKHVGDGNYALGFAELLATCVILAIIRNT